MMLQDLGNNEGGAPELWNVEQVDVVEGVLEGYASSGSRLLTTNTFGGTRARLQMHGLEDRVEELNEAAAQLARRVADRYPGTFVLGDIGPSGELMEPMGDLTIDSAAEMFGGISRASVALTSFSVPWGSGSRGVTRLITVAFWCMRCTWVACSLPSARACPPGWLAWWWACNRF